MQDKVMAVQQEQIKRAIKIAKVFGVTRLILFGRAATEPEQAKDIVWLMKVLLDRNFFS